MQVAVDAGTVLYPGFDIAAMPHNNSGYDIRVGPVEAVHRFIEVKGTQSSEPCFFLSEGERQFSIDHADRYTLLVVVGIDLRTRTHVHVEQREGAIKADTAKLDPIRWRGQLLTA